MTARPKPMLKGEALPADWLVSPYSGPTRIIRDGDFMITTADRVLHEDDALAYRDALVTRSRQGRVG